MADAVKQIRVNVRSIANMKAVRKEVRNGRDVIIVPSATLPDDVVMNEILYPAEEIEKSYLGLNRTPAPLGHPMINGKFISAYDPEGINIGWIGAWNENLRRENGRVFLDKVIDVQRANETEGGRRVLEAINAGGPVHTSTGLLTNLEAANGDVEYKYIARNLEFDHDAVLLDEEGAATPDQGVGMLVNRQGEIKEIEVVNSSIEEDADRNLDWAVDMAARALEQKARVPLLEKLKTALMEAVGLSERDTSNMEKDTMTVSKEQFDELSAKVATLSDSMAGIGDQITEAVTNAIKPVTDAHAEVVANQKAKDDAELADLQKKIVKANLMDEESVNELTLNAARKLAEKAVPGKAAALNGAFGGGSADEFADYDLNKIAEAE